MEESNKPTSFETEYKDLFSLANEVDQLSQNLLEQINSHQIKLFDLPAYKRVFLFILTRALKSYRSIMLLCQNGYGQDVSPLLRGLLENLITAHYLVHDKYTANDKAARFVSYKWVIFKRHLPAEERNLVERNEVKRQEFLNKKKMVFDQVEDFKKKFQVTSDKALVTWSGKTVRDMAMSINENLVTEYETTFRLCSRFSHPSILGDNEYIIQEDKHLVFSPLPSAIGIAPNIRSSIKYILGFLFLTDDLFNLQGKEILTSLEKKCLTFFQQEQLFDDSNRQPKSSTPPIRETIITFKTSQP